jgi:tetratricopeptide (TPR) repeat protein
MPNTPKHSQFSFVPAGQAQTPQLSLDQAMTLATQLQSQGRLHESEHLLQQILQRQPNHAFALHLLGVIAHQVGKNPLAVELIQRAIALSPTPTQPPKPRHKTQPQPSPNTLSSILSRKRARRRTRKAIFNSGRGGNCRFAILH